MNEKSSVRAQAMRKASRATVRPAFAGVVVMALAAFLGTSEPALASPGRTISTATTLQMGTSETGGGTSIAESAQAAGSSAPCIFGGGAPSTCSSSDPEVTKVAYSGSADCSTTYFNWQINWDDGSAVQQLSGYGSAPYQREPIASHVYHERGTYDIQVTGQAANGGSCYWEPSSYTFTLLPQATPSGEACVFDAPRLSRGTVGHVGWGFKLPDGNWEFGANEGPGKRDASNTWAEAGGWDAMLATFTNGGPYDSSGYYTSYECVTVPTFNATAARQEVGSEQHQLYIPIYQDCESQVYNVLSAYGVSGMPNDILTWRPNSWYHDLTTSAGFGPPTSL
jgi:hypothetical protein